MTLPAPNVFQKFVESHPTISANPGTLVTPGAANVMGAAAQVLTASAWSGVSGPGYEIEVEIWGNSVSTAARDLHVTIMKDDAGGASSAAATDWLERLAGGGARFASTGQGSRIYRFPITVPNGCSLFAKAQVNNATAGSVRVAVRIACEPTKPWLLRTGTALVTLGANAATSAGVALASATSEPAWTQIETLGADICFVDFGWCCNDSATQNNTDWIDIAIGDVGTERVRINNARVWEGAAEDFAHGPNGAYVDGASGEKIFARASRINGALDSNESIIIYAVTGRYTSPNAYTVAGTVTIDGVPAPNGEDVDIFAIDGHDIPELVTTVQTSGGTGAFTASVPDNTRQYFARYDDGTNRGVSALGVPV